MTAAPEKKTSRIGFHGVAWAMVMLAILWAGGFACFVHYVESLVPPDDKIRTDAIIVLTGGANRINTGFDMLDRHMADKLLISGVGPNVTEEALVALWRPEAKTPPCCVTLGRLAHNTAQNALEARQWAEKEGVHSLRLVTSAYHIPRAWLEFHAAMPAADILLCPAAPVKEGYEKENHFVLTFTEYNKTLAAWLRLYLWPTSPS